MKKLRKLLKYAHKVNVEHKKRNGRRINDFTLESQFLNLLDEVNELRKSKNEKEEYDILEAGDVMAIFTDIVMKFGWSEKQIEEAAIKKVIQRFGWSKKHLKKIEEMLNDNK